MVPHKQCFSGNVYTMDIFGNTLVLLCVLHMSRESICPLPAIRNTPPYSACVRSHCVCVMCVCGECVSVCDCAN